MPPISPNIIALILIVLLPIIPSYLLFKLLPGNAWVEGPFKGLKINLSGSFAGYFLLFLVLIGTLSSWLGTSYEKWTVTGRIDVGNGVAETYIDPRYVTFSTPSLKSDSDGNFSVTFIRTSDKTFDYPEIYINFPGYIPQTFYLGSKENNFRNDKLPLHVDSSLKTIELGVITLEKLPGSQNAGDALPNSTAANPYQLR